MSFSSFFCWWRLGEENDFSWYYFLLLFTNENQVRDVWAAINKNLRREKLPMISSLFTTPPKRNLDRKHLKCMTFDCTTWNFHFSCSIKARRNSTVWKNREDMRKIHVWKTKHDDEEEKKTSWNNLRWKTEKLISNHHQHEQPTIFEAWRRFFLFVSLHKNTATGWRWVQNGIASIFYFGQCLQIASVVVLARVNTCSFLRAIVKKNSLALECDREHQLSRSHFHKKENAFAPKWRRLCVCEGKKTPTLETGDSYKFERSERELFS